MAPFYALENDQPDAKVHIESGMLSQYIDPKQPPTKRPPFKQIHDVPLIQSVTVTLPEQLAQSIRKKVMTDISVPKYSKVFLRLQDVLDGEFFNEYIKKGDVLMLSEGHAGVDSVFYLKDGILHLELPKEIYERAGLQGKPVRSGARKHQKTRFLVEYNLRLPSMLHGKKGFERLVWAAKNVLNQTRMWLFVDLLATTTAAAAAASLPQKAKSENAMQVGVSSPIDTHCPQFCQVKPNTTLLRNVLVPRSVMQCHSFTRSERSRDEQEETYYEIEEWLDLLNLGIPGVVDGYETDHYLSRYTVPDSSSPFSTVTQDIRTIRWEGLIGARWMTQLVISLIRHLKTSSSYSSNLEVSETQWCAVTAVAHQTQAIGQLDGYSIIFNTVGPSDSEAAPESPTAVTEAATTTTTTKRTEIPPTDNQKSRISSTADSNPSRPVRFLCLQHSDSIT